MEGASTVKTVILIYKITWGQGPEYCNPSI